MNNINTANPGTDVGGMTGGSTTGGYVTASTTGVTQTIVPAQHPCPACGYCPHCGRGGHQTLPCYPIPVWSPWRTYTVTC